MRKYIFSLILFVVSVLCLGSVSHAAYQAPNGNSYNYKYDVHNYGRGRDYTLYSNYPCGLYTSTQGLQNQYRCCIQKDQGLYTIDTVSGNYSVSRTLVYGTSDSGSGTFELTDVCVYMGSSAPDGGMPMYANTTELPIYSNSYATLFQLLKDSVIDFNNIIYDPFIPTPDYSVTYTDDSSTLPRFPLEVSLKNSSSDYYVEVIMENMTPSFVGVKPDGTYEALRYYQFASNFVYPMSDMTRSDQVTTQLLSGSLSAAWRSDINSYDPTSSDSFYVAMSDNETYASSLTFTAQCLRYNILRQIGCFYGNNTGISIRYFRVTDGQVYAGKIRSWTNLYGGVFSESMPEYYKPYETAQGYENTTTEIVPVETANPDTSAPANQYGTKTGLTININTGSNVPNYPDYPTIATYNMDNLLVNAIDTAKQLPKFFVSSIAIFNGMFDGLLPDPFWGIIMAGFLFSIVIMIIKVL